MAERQFGPYRLVRQIAVGGMAEIHLAKARGIAGFEKYVALKMIHPNFAQDDQFIQMLIDEAKIAVQLQHVNIAQTFDLGRVGDTYYITMEYVDGADLYKILRRGSEQDLDVPLDVCAFVAKEVATGLDYAHRKKDMAGRSLGIVHRDVSPQNVLLSYAGEVKLVDFGIAKATMKARQTAVGVIKGKYYYMSPEQAWGDPLDHRSDIFSAGIVLYEMLTGQMLYLEEDLHRLLDMVRRAQIASPSTLRRGIPPQLERIVMHALAKDPQDRYQSAGDMAADLERFLHGYSPVFTASKVAAHLRASVGDPVPAPAPAPAPRDPKLSTQPIGRGELLHDPSELHDENSVIFRVGELRREAEEAEARARGDDLVEETGVTSDQLPRRMAPPGRPAPRSIAPPDFTDSSPTREPARPQVLSMPTMQLGDGDLADIEEMTAISSPPGFEGEAGATGGGLADLGDYEPTMIDSAPAAEAEDRFDEGPTTTRDPNQRAPRRAPSADSGQVTAPVGGGRLRPQPPGMLAHPALSARTPTPAVSELRKPRGSRRTPVGGVPAAGSVLQAIVSSQASEPMPTRQIRGHRRPVGRGPGPARRPGVVGRTDQPRGGPRRGAAQRPGAAGLPAAAAAAAALAAPDGPARRQRPAPEPAPAPPPALRPDARADPAARPAAGAAPGRPAAAGRAGRRPRTPSCRTRRSRRPSPSSSPRSKPTSCRRTCASTSAAPTGCSARCSPPRWSSAASRPCCWSCDRARTPGRRRRC